MAEAETALHPKTLVIPPRSLLVRLVEKHLLSIGFRELGKALLVSTLVLIRVCRRRVAVAALLLLLVVVPPTRRTQVLLRLSMAPPSIPLLVALAVGR